MQQKLTVSLNELVAETIATMRKHFEKEISTLLNKVDSLAAKVNILEERFTSDVPEECDTPLTMHNAAAGSNSNSLERKSYAEMISQSEKVLNQVEKLSVTISNQEKVIEMNDRERREKTIIIMGLEESEESTQVIVSNLIKNKLKLEGIDVSSWRIGKFCQIRKNPRPILVSLNSVKDKRTIMQNRKHLAGSRISLTMTYIQTNKQRKEN